MEGDSKIGKLGGFFTSEGALKTKQQLAAEEKAAQSKASGTTASGSAVQTDLSASSTDPARAALREVRKETLTDINQALSNTKSAGEDISQMKDLVRQERQVLKDLQGKMADPANADEVEQLKQSFADLETDRAALEQEISSNNQSRALDGNTNIKVGNKDFGSFMAEAVRLSPLSTADISSSEGIKAALEERGAAIKDLTSQAQDNRALVGQVRDASVKALQEIKDIQGVLRSEDDALTLSRSVSTEIVKVGAAALEAFNPAKLNAQIMSTLLA